MNLKRKHVEPLGFKGEGPFPDANFCSLYYRVDAKSLTVTILSNLTPQTLSRFVLSKRQFTAFKKGKLSLVPPNCCNASGGPTLEDPKVFFEGEFKNLKHVKELLASIPEVVPLTKNRRIRRTVALAVKADALLGEALRTSGAENRLFGHAITEAQHYILESLEHLDKQWDKIADSVKRMERKLNAIPKEKGV